MKHAVRWFFALGFAGAGALHFVDPEAYVRIMPPYLPWHFELVILSGFFEIAGGLGLLIPRLRRAAAFGLAALLLAVLPANIHMAVHHLPFGTHPVPTWLLWARLPFQAMLLAGVLWCASPGRGRATGPTVSHDIRHG